MVASAIHDRWRLVLTGGGRLRLQQGLAVRAGADGRLPRHGHLHLFRNVYPFPSGSAWWGPGLFLGIVALTAIGIAARPAVARRAGELLTRDQGLAPAADQDTDSATNQCPPVLRNDLTQSP
ncbi:hypothetical protein [Streptomyces mirabilis]|uniref:hypothetical protein n=1 Tax=Streptomyces mirabilis TaxID=68239 RepID=UPI0036830096